MLQSAKKLFEISQSLYKLCETETSNALAELAPLMYGHTDTQYHFMYNNSNQLLITILLIGVLSNLGMVVSIDSYRFLFSNNQTLKLNCTHTHWECYREMVRLHQPTRLLSLFLSSMVGTFDEFGGFFNSSSLGDSNYLYDYLCNVWLVKR